MRFIPPLSVTLCAIMSAQPALHIDKRHHALGTISAQEKSKLTFRISNRGDEPLGLLKLELPADCLSGSLPKKLLPPGEEIILELRLDPKKLKGRVQKSAFLSSNDPQQKEITLSFSAEVVPDILYSPQVLEFNEMQRSAKDTAIISLKASSGKPLKILEAKTDLLPLLKHRVEKGAAILEVEMDGAKLPAAGSYGKGIITLSLDHPTSPVLNIPYRWALVPSLNFWPAQLDFNTLPTQAKDNEKPVRRFRSTRVLRIRQQKQRPFRILTILEKPDFIRVEGIPTAALPEHLITVHANPALVKDEPFGILHFSTDDLDQKELKVRVYAKP